MILKPCIRVTTYTNKSPASYSKSKKMYFRKIKIYFKHNMKIKTYMNYIRYK